MPLGIFLFHQISTHPACLTMQYNVYMDDGGRARGQGHDIRMHLCMYLCYAWGKEVDVDET